MSNYRNLDVKTIEPGSGDSPKNGQTVTVHYTGYLAVDGGENGKKFDSSKDRNKPFQFILGAGQVIKGWDVGVAKMSKGEKAILKIPTGMGYGKAGAGGVIPPNADLNFEVELLDFK